MRFQKCNIQSCFSEWYLQNFLWYYPQMNGHETLMVISQCRLNSLLPYGVTRPQWVNSLSFWHLGPCKPWNRNNIHWYHYLPSHRQHIIYRLLSTIRKINEIEGTHLTHWGRVKHICIGKLIIIGSDNGLSPGRRQAIIWTNAGIWSIRPLGTHFSEILIEILTFSFKKMHLKMSSAKWRLFCLGLNELSWLVNGDNNSTSVYNISTGLPTSGKSLQ